MSRFSMLATEDTALLLSFEECESSGTKLGDDDASNSHTNNNNLKRATILLYTSHFFAKASEGTWQFGLVLFLSAMCDHNSLLLVSTYGLVSALTGFLFGGAAGRFVDYTPRLHATRIFIWTENFSVVLATVCCYFLLSRKTYDIIEERMILDTTTIVLLLGVHILGSLAYVLDRGFNVAIERDWVVVMSKMAVEGGVESAKSAASTKNGIASKESEEFSTDYSNEGDLLAAIREKRWLSQTNVSMRQIDLTCNLTAPSLTGFIIVCFGESDKDLRVACLFVGILNVLSLLVEYECTKRIYGLVPALSIKKLELSEKGSNERKGDGDQQEIPQPVSSFSEPNATPSHLRKSMVGRELFKYFKRNPVPSEWRIYFSQSIAPAGFSVALLYLNTLNFGAVMTSYLVWRNMRLDAIGFWRGLSSAIGLLGTVAYHKSVSVISLESTGQWSITAQFTCLLLCYFSLMVTNTSASLAMLIGGTCISRVGWWVFDLSITQMMQQRVPDVARGSIGGVQDSLEAFFTLLTFVLGILVPNPRDFHYFIELGCSSVGLALVCFTIGVYLKQNNKPIA